MTASLVMNVEGVHAEFLETVHELLGLNNHKMKVERLGAILGNILQNRKTERNVRHENSIHDIQMEPVSLTAVDHLKVLAKITEIGGKEGGGYYCAHLLCFESLIWLKNAIETLTEECVLGITVNKERCLEMVKNSIGIVTALNPYIGYKTSTKVAKEALETNRSVYDIVLEKGLMTQEKLDEALDPSKMLASHKF